MMRRRFVVLVLLIACGDDDRIAFDTGVSSDGAVGDVESSSDASPGDVGARDASSADAGAPGLGIAFDYRFDGAGFFMDPARRAALEAAAAEWSAILVDEFEDIPAGTTIRTRDPESPDTSAMNFASESVIDDVLIFVGCASFSGGIAQSSNPAAIGSVADTALATRLQERYAGARFQPWTGWISFNCDQPWFFDATPATNDDIPGEQNDFHSTAMHEIGHVLGFGTSDAFANLVDNGVFTGAEAVGAYGMPVPMTASGVHFQSSVISDGEVTLMDVSRTVGTRTPATRLDRAAMSDIGYTLR
ncbi:MAG: hypothetical protein ACI9KE_002682 [Polyangiales bacterium]|jgi:hypothetical protein